MKLAQYVTGKGYNITCDNFFTSLQLAKRLANEKISIVGTMRKNRRELSKKMTEAENGGLVSSFGIATVEASLLSINQNQRKQYACYQVCIDHRMWTKLR